MKTGVVRLLFKAGSGLCGFHRQCGGDRTAESAGACPTSDVVMICVGNTAEIETEGKDRDHLNLLEGQEELILAVSKDNPRTIVILNSGAAVLMNHWIDQIPVLLEAQFPGQKGGNALADVLFGDANPSGKLPITFPKRWENAAAYGNNPGEDGAVHYAERIVVGYHHFDKGNLEPLFPFGYGLSYTTFSYQDLIVEPTAVNQHGKIKISLIVENTGSPAGAEVVQLYVQDLEASVPRPMKELKGFKKVFLKSHQKQRISFDMDQKAQAFYDIVKKNWGTEPGEFQLVLGSSSKDIRLECGFDLK